MVGLEVASHRMFVAVHHLQLGLFNELTCSFSSSFRVGLIVSEALLFASFC